MTDYSDITDLYMVADCLVTDYSSTVVEYVLLDKPIILFAYDLDKYDRGFYRDYRSTVRVILHIRQKNFCSFCKKMWIMLKNAKILPNYSMII